MRRREVLRLGAGAAAFVSLRGNPALATTVLKVSDVHPTAYPTVVAVENMGKKLSNETSGRLSVQIFPAMTLGGEKETLEQTQIGAIQMARVSVGALGPVVNDIN